MALLLPSPMINLTEIIKVLQTIVIAERAKARLNQIKVLTSNQFTTGRTSETNK